MRKIWIPINITNSHWTLVYVSIEKQDAEYHVVVKYYDGLGGTGTEYTNRVSEYLQLQFKQRGRHSLKLSIETIAVDNCPTQNDQWECGVHLIHTVRDLLLDITPSHRSAVALQVYREHICDVILRGYISPRI